MNQAVETALSEMRIRRADVWISDLPRVVDLLLRPDSTQQCIIERVKTVCLQVSEKLKEQLKRGKTYTFQELKELLILGDLSDEEQDHITSLIAFWLLYLYRHLPRDSNHVKMDPDVLDIALVYNDLERVELGEMLSEESLEKAKDIIGVVMLRLAVKNALNKMMTAGDLIDLVKTFNETLEEKISNTLINWIYSSARKKMSTVAH